MLSYHRFNLKPSLVQYIFVFPIKLQKGKPLQKGFALLKITDISKDFRSADILVVLNAIKEKSRRNSNVNVTSPICMLYSLSELWSLRAGSWPVNPT